MVWRYRCFDRCFGLVPEKVTQVYFCRLGLETSSCELCPAMLFPSFC